MGNIFYTRKFLSTRYTDINEQDISFLDCKHTHMMKSGAPPDKFRVVPYGYLKNSMVSQAELNSKGYHSLVPGLTSIFYRWYGSL